MPISVAEKAVRRPANVPRMFVRAVESVISLSSIGVTLMTAQAEPQKRSCEAEENDGNVGPPAKCSLAIQYRDEFSAQHVVINVASHRSQRVECFDTLPYE